MNIWDIMFGLLAVATLVAVVVMVIFTIDSVKYVRVMKKIEKEIEGLR